MRRPHPAHQHCVVYQLIQHLESVADAAGAAGQIHDEGLAGPSQPEAAMKCRFHNVRAGFLRSSSSRPDHPGIPTGRLQRSGLSVGANYDGFRGLVSP